MTCTLCRQRPARRGRPYCHVCDPGPAPVDRKLAKRAETPHSSWHFDPAFRRVEGGLKEEFVDDQYRPKPEKKK